MSFSGSTLVSSVGSGVPPEQSLHSAFDVRRWAFGVRRCFLRKPYGFAEPAGDALAAGLLAAPVAPLPLLPSSFTTICDGLVTEISVFF